MNDEQMDYLCLFTKTSALTGARAEVFFRNTFLRVTSRTTTIHICMLIQQHTCPVRQSDIIAYDDMIWLCN